MKLMFAMLLLAPTLVPLAAQEKNWATGTKGMVASVHPLATAAGVEALEKGGNAVDAAIATALTLGVVDGYNSGIGGGCFIMIRTADGELIAIDGREIAPAAAHRDMYLVDGKPIHRLSKIGALAVGVPGALKAYDQAIERYGKLKFADLLNPAADIAESGFKISSVYAETLKSQQRSLKQFAASAKVLLKPDRTPYVAGDALKQIDLANTYRNIANDGVDWFYKGPFAEAIEKWMEQNSGVIRASDLHRYQTVMRKPIQTTYRGYQIVGFPPPSSGGVHVAQILNIVERFDLKKMHQDDPIVLQHVVAEAMKLAFADRAFWLGDPAYVDVPKQLISKEYARQLSAKIDLTQTSLVQSHGIPPNADSEFFEKHTTHLTAADDDGNWVAITTTVNTPFGAKVIIPGTGVILNNQMDDFSIAPGVPNSYGLVGSENNAIAPGKRPLSSMSPTFVLKDGQPVFTVGAAGGPKIITQAVWGIINHLDLGMPPGQAIAQPRIHHQWSPDVLMIESTLPKSYQDGLIKRGHRLKIRSAVGVSQAISYDANTKQFFGAHDPRVPGMAAGR